MAHVLISFHLSITYFLGVFLLRSSFFLSFILFVYLYLFDIPLSHLLISFFILYIIFLSFLTSLSSPFLKSLSLLLYIIIFPGIVGTRQRNKKFVYNFDMKPKEKNMKNLDVDWNKLLKLILWK